MQQFLIDNVAQFIIMFNTYLINYEKYFSYNWNENTIFNRSLLIKTLNFEFEFEKEIRVLNVL